MKKIIVLLSVLIVALSTNAQEIKVTATVRAGKAIDTTDFWLNPDYIQYIKKATAPLVGYVDASNSKAIIEYKVTQNFDTLVNQSNRAFAYVVKLLNITSVASNRDTSIMWGYPLTKFVEVKAKAATTSMPNMHTTIAAKQNNPAGYSRWDIRETPAAIKTRVDSLIRVARDSTY